MTLATYTWDAENRLTGMQSLSTLPAAARQKLDFTYDSQWRRTQKIVSSWNGSAYVPQSTNRFVYDGWNLIAVLDHQSALVQSFTWGLDLSGSMQGAGGVGGLLFVSEISNGEISNSCCPAFDGNGNVMGLVSFGDGTVQAQYEYGPFGEVLRATGPVAKANPFRFSTKYQDDEPDLLYDGCRYYGFGVGRWLSRDPIQEDGGLDLYAFAVNAPTSFLDVLGMDFIAVAGRDVKNTGTLFGHYSLQYWLSCGDEAPTAEQDIETWRNNHKGSNKARSVELLVDDGWRVWGKKPGTGHWSLLDTKISVIHFGDNNQSFETGKRFRSVFRGPPAPVKQRWRLVESLGRAYRFAEQLGFNGAFRHWLDSKYGLPWHNQCTAIYIVIAVADSPALITGALAYQPGMSKLMGDSLPGHRQANLKGTVLVNVAVETRTKTLSLSPGQTYKLYNINPSVAGLRSTKGWFIEKLDVKCKEL